MVARASRPTVFISSTIADFLDLRGALKFWLEESGYEVWLSEYSDMEKNLGANTFHACFETIRRADYYVLLIGKDRGSFYSEPDGTSVTQQEYRVARDAFMAQGHPILVLFVRSKVKDLLGGWGSAGRTGEPPFRDASFVDSFISEVERVEATTDAVKGIGPYPLANWLHRFSDFREIVDALRVALSIRVDVPLQRLLAGIKIDLEKTLAALMDRIQLRSLPQSTQKQLAELVEGQSNASPEEKARMMDTIKRMELELPLPRHRRLQDVVQQVPLDGVSQNALLLTPDQADALFNYLFAGTAPSDGIHLDALQVAMQKGELLNYDPSSRLFIDTELSTAVADLIDEAGAHDYRYKLVEPLRAPLIESILTAKRTKLGYFALDWNHAVLIWGLFNSQVNLYRRAASVYAYLQVVKESPAPGPLLPSSPGGELVNRRIREERYSRSEIQELLKWRVWEF